MIRGKGGGQRNDRGEGRKRQFNYWIGQSGQPIVVSTLHECQIRIGRKKNKKTGTIIPITS